MKFQFGRFSAPDVTATTRPQGLCAGIPNVELPLKSFSQRSPKQLCRNTIGANGAMLKSAKRTRHRQTLSGYESGARGPKVPWTIHQLCWPANYR